ncbi:MAG: hypothetical protein J6Z12_03365, partial [Paludibacteraceae bacterium]|nr:hypothetical protein [Paludibacteraceae bacterium]
IASFAWNGGGNTATKAIDRAGTYTVTVTAANSCTATASITIGEDFTEPAVSINASSTTIDCSGDPVTLTAQGDAASYQWSTGANTASIQVGAADTYTVTAIAANGCTNTASQTITADATVPTVSINATADNFNCNVDAITLTAQGSNIASFAWNGGGNTATKAIDRAGTYTVTVTAANSCTATASITIGEDFTEPAVSINASSNTIGCAGNVTLTAQGNATSYAWSNGGNTAQITVNAADTYTVTATGANGCTAQASQVITADAAVPDVTINASNTTIGCTGSVTLTAVGNAASYAWSNGANTVQISVEDAGTYTVTATGANGCTAQASQTITTDTTVPNVTISATTTTFGCATQRAILTASGENVATYRWSTGKTGASITVTQTGTYTVTAIAANGCTAQAEETIIEDRTTPVVTILADRTDLNCYNPTATLTAQGDNIVSYLWNNYETTATVTRGRAGTYSVTATGVNGCTGQASITLTADLEKPTVHLSKTTGILTCDKLESVLSVTASDDAGGYVWTPSGTGSTQTVTTAGTYTVTVTAANGCSKSAWVTIEEDKTAPVISIDASTTDLNCNQMTATLTAVADNYKKLTWSTGKNTAAISVDEPGTYTLSAIGYNGCESQAAQTITDHRVMPTAEIIATPEPLITSTRPSIVLSAVVDDDCTYRWNTGLANQDLNVGGGGIYTLTVTNQQGCQAEASIEVFSTIGVGETEFHFSVIGGKDLIQVFFDGTCDVQLYTLSGRKMADRRQIREKTLFRGLDAGMYLVVVNGRPRKVIVR